MQLSRIQVVMVAAAIVLLVSPPGMGGDDDPAQTGGEEAAVEWPSEQEKRLEELDGQVLETKRKLFTAKYHKDSAAVEKLTQEYKDQQKERIELLRATGQLPPR
jgi:hypothetical protein